MSEVETSPENEYLKSHSVVARNLAGEEIQIGKFILTREGGIEFYPSTQEAFKGNLRQRINKKDFRVYVLDIESDKPYPTYMIFGDRRRKEGDQTFVEIEAGKGVGGDIYSTWDLTEDQWQRMDEWLQANLKPKGQE